MTERVKYPKTPHVPWSIGTSDDKTLKTDEQFRGRNVVVTLKMDGENTSIYNDGMHARSLESANHPSQSWVKKLAGEIGYKLGYDWRVCGENLYAKHTVKYDSLESYFMVFSIWHEELCLSWKKTEEQCERLGLITTPVIYQGPYDPTLILMAYEPYAEENEGYVIRVEDEFLYKDFDKSVAKFVNSEFRQTLKESTIHWASAQVIPNKLKDGR